VENSTFLKKHLIINVNINKIIKSINIKKKKLFPKIILISLLLLFKKSTNGTKNIINKNEIYL